MGGKNASQRGAITIGFSEEVNRSTFNNTNVLIRSGTQLISGQYDLSGDGLVGTFKPFNPFTPGDQVDILVATGIKDIQGNKMKASFQSHFTVKDPLAPPSSKRALSSIYPKRGWLNWK